MFGYCCTSFNKNLITTKCNQNKKRKKKIIHSNPENQGIHDFNLNSAGKLTRLKEDSRGALHYLKTDEPTAKVAEIIEGPFTKKDPISLKQKDIQELMGLSEITKELEKNNNKVSRLKRNMVLSRVGSIALLVVTVAALCLLGIYDAPIIIGATLLFAIEGCSIDAAFRKDYEYTNYYRTKEQVDSFETSIKKAKAEASNTREQLTFDPIKEEEVFSNLCLYKEQVLNEEHQTTGQIVEKQNEIKLLKQKIKETRISDTKANLKQQIKELKKEIKDLKQTIIEIKDEYNEVNALDARLLENKSYLKNQQAKAEAKAAKLEYSAQQKHLRKCQRAS